MAPPANAATFTVSNTADSGPGSFPQAILDANVASSAGVNSTITFDPVINGLPIVGNGLPPITADATVVPGSITIQGNGVGQTIIETPGSNAIQILTGNTTVAVADLTIRGDGDGGMNAAVTPAATGTIVLEDIQVENGFAFFQSAGAATVNLARLDVIDNSRIYLGNAPGGSLTATMTDSRVENSFREALTVEGAGVSLTVERSLIANIDDDGVTILDGATLLMRNSTVTGIGDGQDGIRVDGPTTLVNVTIRNVEGFGIVSVGEAFEVPVSLTNTIIADTARGSCSGSLAITSGGGNITDDATCGLTQPGDLEDTVASLGTLADNGGRTRTILPLAGSPAIDGGVVNGCPPVDQRGFERPADGDGDAVAVCDSGAVEVAAVQATTTTTTSAPTDAPKTDAPTTDAPATAAPTTAPTVTLAPILPATGPAESTGIGLVAAGFIALGSLVLLIAVRRRPAT